MSEPAARRRDLSLEATRVASGRIGRLVFAYVLMVVAGALLRTFGLVLEESLTTGFDGAVRRYGWASLVVVPTLTALVTFVAAAPFATAFFVVAESLGARGRLAWIVAGALVAVVTQGLGSVFGFGEPEFGLVLLDAIVGGVAGALGWVVAVRSAPPPPRRDPWADL